jgi:hypothetical protein
MHLPQHQHAALRALAPPPNVPCPCPPQQNVAIDSNVYYNCGHTSHFTRECVAPKQIGAPHAQGHSNHPLKVVAAKTGWVNYTTMESIPKGEQGLAGTFSLTGYPIIILFDFEATHDFISKACTQKCRLIIEHISTPYMICTLGGNITTKQLVIATPINLAGRLNKANLIVLDGQGINVILGMV